jgi:rhodanese-related sulfurtransferase
VDDAACARHAVDIAAFASCDNGRAARPGPEIDPLPVAGVPAHKRATAAQHVDAVQAYVLKHEHPGDVALVDIRAAAEHWVAGAPAAADVQVPFREFMLPLAWDAATGGWQMRANAAFVPEVEAALGAGGFGRDALIVLICRSGERSAAAADALAARGYTRVVTVIDGFEGDIDADGARSLNGWKNAGLPWVAVAAPRMAAR